MDKSTVFTEHYYRNLITFKVPMPSQPTDEDVQEVYINPNPMRDLTPDSLEPSYEEMEKRKRQDRYKLEMAMFGSSKKKK
jgi:hypothetical protein